MPMADEPVVVFERVTKRLGRALVVDELHLEVRPGRVVALVGPNGAGKSMTLRMLLGLVAPTSGRVVLFGEPVRPGASVLRRVGALVDGPAFVPHLSGIDNLRLACRLLGRPVAPTELDALVELTGLGRAISKPYRTYSHGMRYRLGLAQALLGRPELVVLDEPTNGLDPAQVLEVRSLVRALAADGRTVVLSTHLLDEVDEICDEVAVLIEGRLVASGPVEEIRGTRSRFADAYLALALGATGEAAVSGGSPAGVAEGQAVGSR
jgi:ABC-2 type transport system ATP-binding protein